MPKGAVGHLWIFLTKEDRARLHVDCMEKLPFGQTRFTSFPSFQWVLKRKKHGLGEACVFLSEGRCTIHSVRPTQCRTFPYWPELINRRSWRSVKDSLSRNRQRLRRHRNKMKCFDCKRVRTPSWKMALKYIELPPIVKRPPKTMKRLSESHQRRFQKRKSIFPSCESLHRSKTDF